MPPKLRYSTTFDYADKVGLVACSATELQESIDVWCTALTDNGLKLNTSKCEVMSVSRVPEELHISVNGYELKQVHQFYNLGVTYDRSAIKETTCT